LLIDKGNAVSELIAENDGELEGLAGSPR